MTIDNPVRSHKAIGSMGLVYLPTFRLFFMVNVGKKTYMNLMGMIESLRKEIVSIINVLGIFISSFGGSILPKTCIFYSRFFSPNPGEPNGWVKVCIICMWLFQFSVGFLNDVLRVFKWWLPSSTWLFLLMFFTRGTWNMKISNSKPNPLFFLVDPVFHSKKMILLGGTFSFGGKLDVHQLSTKKDTPRR